MSRMGRVVSLFSTKGGVGKTSLATNLATALSIQFHLKTAFLSLAPSASDSDTTKMMSATGVRWVSDPATPETLPSLVESLRRTCDEVIIDAGSVFSPLALAALEHSNLIVVVITPDLPSLRHATQTIQLLESAQFPLRMITAALNRAESRGNFRSSEMRQQLPVDVIAEIPSDGRTVGLAINQGLPFVLASPKSRISGAITAFAKFLVEHPAVFVEHVTIDRAALPASITEPQPAHHDTGEQAAQAHEPMDPVVALKRTLHHQLVEELDLKRLETRVVNNPSKTQELRQQVQRVVLDLLAREHGLVAGPADRARLVKEIVDEAIGLGPLEDLLADQEISDILVNGSDMIYVEKHGKLSLTDKRFVSNEQVLTVIERIIAPLGRRIDESTPMVDARLPDGSRVHAIIAPLSIKGPILSIRKFGRQRYTMEELIRAGTLTSQMAGFLSVCVRGRKNLIVSGGTGSGKTTLLNALSSSIPDDERILTIEDAAELRLAQQHWVALEARMPNIEGKGEVTVRQLFRNTLRMRPDRIVIGECRGDETFDMLQAMNTGHDGSLTTLHANSPRDVISRLDSLVLMSNVDLPVRAIREQIASAIHVIVHTARLSDGSRKVTAITELLGLTNETEITFQDLFVFRQAGVASDGAVLGEFVPTGKLPTFMDELRAKGIAMDASVFGAA